MSRDFPSRVVVDLEAYAANLGVVRRLAGPQCRVIAVIKANAYGHGFQRMARAALDAGAAMLAVAMVHEAVALREAGITAPILVLVQPDPEGLPALVAHDLEVMLSDVAAAEALGAAAHRAGRVAAVHCKVDTGMGRQGFACDRAAAEIVRVTRISNLDVVGIATHFPNAEAPDDPFTREQVKRFRGVLRELEKGGVPFEMVHAANSAAVVNYHDSLFDAVRTGLMTYGVWPSTGTPVPGLLQPVLRWEARIAQVRDLPKGATVGYGSTYTTPAPMRAAVLPVGYADGYRIQLSNRADVLLHGRRCPVRGRISMDQTVVDVTHLPVRPQPGEVAVLIGRDGDEQITAEELAERAGTIPYDILTGIGRRVWRAYRP
jgi:alanine racemase